MSSEKLFYFMPEEWVILALAFVGGYVDSAGYILLDGLFTSSITGNIVAASTAIYHNDGAFARASVTVSFALAASVAVFCILRLKLVNEWNKKPIGMLLFTLEAVFMIIAVPIGLVYQQEISSNGAIFRWPLIVVGSILGASMGVHNAAAKEYVPNCPATTVMTMTLVSVSIALPQMIIYTLASKCGVRLHPYHKDLPSDYNQQMLSKMITSTANFVKITKPLVAFVVGAIIGAVITNFITYYSLLITAAIVLFFVFDIYSSRFIKKEEEELALEVVTGDSKSADKSRQLSKREDSEQSSRSLDEISVSERKDTLYDKVEDIDDEEHAIEIFDEDQTPISQRSEDNRSIKSTASRQNV